MDTDIFYVRHGETIYHVQLIRPAAEDCRLTEVLSGRSHTRSAWDLLWRLAASDEFTKIEDQFAADRRYGDRFR